VKGFGELDRETTVCGLGTNLEIGVVVEEGSDATSNEFMIVDE